MSRQELADARIAAAEQAARVGIASVHEMGGPDSMGEEDFDAWLHGDWPVEVVPYWGGLDLRFVIERDLRHIGGDIWLDGSLGSHTAALREPYADDPTTRGNLEFDDTTLTDLFREATHAGIQVAVHAIGDEAIHQAVRCWRAVDDDLPDYLEGGVRRLRHRIEHGELMRPDLLEEVADLGLVVSTQPTFETTWGMPGGMYEKRLGTRPRRVDQPVPLAGRPGCGAGLRVRRDLRRHGAVGQHRGGRAPPTRGARHHPARGRVGLDPRGPQRRAPGPVRRRRARRYACRPGRLGGRPLRDLRAGPGVLACSPSCGVGAPTGTGRCPTGPTDRRPRHDRRTTPCHGPHVDGLPA